VVPRETHLLDERMTAIMGRLVGPDGDGTPGLPILDPAPWLEGDVDPAARAAAAFLVAVAGASHPGYDRAVAELESSITGPARAVALFFRDGLDRMAAELERVARANPAFVARLGAAATALGTAAGADQVTDAAWTVFFPQAAGIRGNEDRRIRDLRAARTVTVTGLAADPMTDPSREVLFTSNVLLTVPATASAAETLPYPPSLRDAIHAAAAEPQRYWFDHPIQIGVDPAGNELLYGLRGFDAALDAEQRTGRATCLLSVSVTHDGLGVVARPYVEVELERAGGLHNLDVVAVTEGDARLLVDQVLVPALALVMGEPAAAAAAQGLREVVGVDGEYGRHYSFLKAVAALWHVTVDPTVRATFKIDLDQVFAQEVLLAETGRTAFGHLATPLWGATAVDSTGREIELGMLAGALVNERDIASGLFTPDVALPSSPPVLDEHVFHSALPQGISTRAEMMERYDGPARDGVIRALERIHVTGGTNGIRVDALRRHRPFSPTFIGRAEDQAYVMSVLGQPGPRLAYVHAAGLIMRHDKEAFAGEAMAAAHVGKLVGDDVRIVAFSAYADAAAGNGSDGGLDRLALGRLLDPFTGGFVSVIPQTVVLLRIALRTIRLFAAGQPTQAREYASIAARRVPEAFELFGDPEDIARRVRDERIAWNHYYDALDVLERGIAAGDASALALRDLAVQIIDSCRVGGEPVRGDPRSWPANPRSIR
jgi:hypothetical protein